MSDFLSIYGRYTELRKSGRVWKGLCVFHSEKTPSFTVYPDGSYFCFGCGASGGIEWFLHEMGEKIEVSPQIPIVSPKTREIAFNASHNDILAWSQALENHTPALRYLEGRGIVEAMRDDAMLGWIGENDKRIPEQYRASFANKIVIPYLTAQDEPIGMKLRSIDKKEFRAWGNVGEPYGLWNALNFGRSVRRVTFFLEGEFDALLVRSIFEHDWRYRAIASPAKHIKQGHVDALLGVAGRRVLLADNDEAGYAHAELMQALIPCLEIYWTPEFKDCGDFFRMAQSDCVEWIKEIAA